MHFKKKKSDNKKNNIVQAGLYDIKDNADKMCARIKKLGFDAIVKKVDGKHMVQCGVFDEKENAVKLINALKQHGIDAILKLE